MRLRDLPKQYEITRLTPAVCKWLMGRGFDVWPEFQFRPSRRRIDLLATLGKATWLVECKWGIAEGYSLAAAIAQLEGYAQDYGKSAAKVLFVPKWEYSEARRQQCAIAGVHLMEVDCPEMTDHEAWAAKRWLDDIAEAKKKPGNGRGQ